MSKLKLAGMALGAVVALLALDTVGRRGQVEEAIATDIGNMIDKARPGNTVKPSSVSIPLSMALPIPASVVASQWEGYFTMARKDGSPISERCASIGIPFIVRVVAGGQYGMEVSPENAQKIWDCQ